jgi:hypothetical protein
MNDFENLKPIYKESYPETIKRKKRDNLKKKRDEIIDPFESLKKRFRKPKK